MTSQNRSHQRIFGSKVVFPALRGYIVEYDFAHAQDLTEEKVKSTIAVEASTHGVEEASIQVRTDHTNGRAYLVARVELDKAQFDAVTQLVGEPGWVQQHFLDKGLMVVGMRIETRILVSFAINDSRHRRPGEEHAAQSVVARRSKAQDFDRNGRHYTISDDGRDWIDTGPTKACCGCG